jgi:hypothetical protein
MCKRSIWSMIFSKQHFCWALAVTPLSYDILMTLDKSQVA